MTSPVTPAGGSATLPNILTIKADPGWQSPNPTVTKYFNLLNIAGVNADLRKSEEVELAPDTVKQMFAAIREARAAGAAVSASEFMDAVVLGKSGLNFQIEDNAFVHFGAELGAAVKAGDADAAAVYQVLRAHFEAGVCRAADRMYFGATGSAGAGQSPVEVLRIPADAPNAYVYTANAAVPGTGAATPTVNLHSPHAVAVPASGQTELVQALSALKPQTIRTLTDFQSRLLEAVAAKSPDKSAYVSGLSVSTAMIIWVNCIEGAAAQRQALDALGFKGMSVTDVNQAARDLIIALNIDQPGIKTVFANSLWLRSDVKQAVTSEFTNGLRNNFEATVGSFTGGADGTTKVNGWVGDKTDKNITDLVSEDVMREATAVIANAFYASLNWQTKLNVTTDGNSAQRKAMRDSSGAALLAGGKPVTGVELTLKKQELPMISVFGVAEGVAIPYVDPNLPGLSLYRVLLKPVEGVDPAKLTQISGADISTALRKGLLAPKKVNVSVPAHTISSKAELAGILGDMGIPLGTPMTKLGENDSASAVIHAVKELFSPYGTKTAAATAVVVTRSISTTPSFDFFEGPFLSSIAMAINGEMLVPAGGLFRGESLTESSPELDKLVAARIQEQAAEQKS